MEAPAQKRGGEHLDSLLIELTAANYWLIGKATEAGRSYIQM
jgi:hypothetical protein